MSANYHPTHLPRDFFCKRKIWDTEFHNNPTNHLAAHTTSQTDRQTDRRRLYILFTVLLRKVATTATRAYMLCFSTGNVQLIADCRQY